MAATPQSQPAPIERRSPAAVTDNRLTFEGHETLAQLFLARTAELGDKTAHMEKHYGIWHSYSWNDYRTAVANIAGALAAQGLSLIHI